MAPEFLENYIPHKVDQRVHHSVRNLNDILVPNTRTNILKKINKKNRSSTEISSFGKEVTLECFNNSSNGDY